MSDDDFSRRVLAWFELHGRKDLPWQQQPTPYRVWVSEIMLQQTRVQTVIPYYRRFMQSFADIRGLAAASLDEVLHHWSGLGYYARARNLHRAAQVLRDRYQAQFPEDLQAVQQLPGIGRSTAAAILSLACGQRHAILDGNVKRVLARYFAVDGWPGKTSVLQQLWELAENCTPQTKVAWYNQAMMDLGATLCTRGRPACDRCPLQSGCQASKQGRQQQLPSPKPRKSLPVREVQMVLMVNADAGIYLEQRPPSGIWGGLWSFPEFDSGSATIHDWCTAHGIRPHRKPQRWPVLRHTFSHFHLDITPHYLRIQDPGNRVMEADQGVWYNSRQPEALGLAAPVKRLLELVKDAD
jgi:A/G-specific adenine glycosylase